MINRPNIILIVADDMGYGDCGCYGSDLVGTPRLDALAAGGVRFTDFHSNGAVCSPTRAALLTGRYQQRSGIEDIIFANRCRHIGLPVEETTFAQLLKANGYTNALFGKWHLGYKRKFSPIHRGFDEFRGFVSGNVDYKSHIDQAGYEDWWSDDELEPEDGYTTDLVTEHGLRFIEKNSDKPFCLYLAHECPHFPYQGPADDAYRTPGNPEPVHGPRADQHQAYKEMMGSMDTGIGRIVDRVAALGLAERTLIFFFSDNGPCGPGSAGPLRGAKGTVWEGGHRVPAIAYWPGVIDAGTETSATCMSMDLFPTMLSIAGATPPADLMVDGIDIMPAMTGDFAAAERTLFWRYRHQRAVRKGEWKMVIEHEGALPQLFTLAGDLSESDDIAANQPEIVNELMSKLAEWEEDVSAAKRST